MSYEEGKVVLCGSNGYNKKYYFNGRFAGIPKPVQEELKIMCVWFTEECGGILTLEFDAQGNLQFVLATSEYDGYSDKIGADLKVRQLRQERQELFRSLELYYKTAVRGQYAENEQERGL